MLIGKVAVCFGDWLLWQRVTFFIKFIACTGFAVVACRFACGNEVDLGNPLLQLLCALITAWLKCVEVPETLVHQIEDFWIKSELGLVVSDDV